MGATGAGALGEGISYVVFGPVSGTAAIGDVATGLLRGEDLDYGAGNVVSFLCDLDGSGRTAIGVSAQYANRGGSDAGAAYVVFETLPN